MHGGRGGEWPFFDESCVRWPLLCGQDSRCERNEHHVREDEPNTKSGKGFYEQLEQEKITPPSVK